ncbi:MAG: hypothetical protein AB7S41_01615 [Parvibaculaceae bacterium]
MPIFAAEAPYVMVLPAAAQQAQKLWGIVGEGPKSDLDRLEMLGRKAGFPTSRLMGPNGPEVMILFLSKNAPGYNAGQQGRRFIKKLDQYRWKHLQLYHMTGPSIP